MTKTPMVLPEWFNLPQESRVVEGRDGQRILVFNSSMATLYQQTCGEQSRFFLALAEGRIIAGRCPKCGMIMVPPMTWRCPTCDFIDLEEVEMPHQGVLAATAPITIFARQSMEGKAPYARGYLDLAPEAPIASFWPIALRTTTGVPRRGVFAKGTPITVVFEDDRPGPIPALCVFGVPTAEIPETLRTTRPLLASMLQFEGLKLPEVALRDELKPKLDEALAAIEQLSRRVSQSARAQKDLAGRKHTIRVRTGGGDFMLIIDNGQLTTSLEQTLPTDFTVVADDPGVFTSWVNDGSLTDAAVEARLWMPSLEAFEVLPILDRLPRSVRRDEKQSVNPAQHKAV